MKPVTIPVPLSREQLDIMTMALWHWEGSLRTWRLDAKKAGDSKGQASLERDIARVKRLKERMFRVKPRLKQEPPPPPPPSPRVEALALIDEARSARTALESEDPF
ncbi:hypothetical protein J2S76_004226 [Ancylobacter vacuolatus]|uniref:Transposase n=1 Tax=Ancylobacter vacuolatus TaxID=223389 RepID=A0ABU0DN09_9HYPH|nr:hypothetical protein [Ancylobacter vacuolatus]MDQ0349775.1 hypothetical protein [Ancylobacter vacuolatus]